MERKIFYKKTKKLTSTEKHIISIIEKESNIFKNISISKFAELCNCSISSISKMCRKLGFDNYKSMQIWFNNEIILNDNNQITPNASSISAVAKNIKNNHTLVLQRTFNDIDLISLKKIKKIIKNCQIMTFGIGSSSIAAHELYGGLSKIGYFAKQVESIHNIFLNINQKNKENNVLMIFSNEAKSKEIYSIRKIANLHKVKLVLFTSNQTIKEQENEIIIRYRTVFQKKRITALTSKISQLYIVDVLINWIAEYTKNSIYETFIKEWKTK